MLQRSYDSKFINSIINDERIYPWVARLVPRGDLDVSVLLKNNNNVLLVTEGGGFLFEYISDKRYFSHAQFLPGFRGKYVFDACKEALRTMFEQHDAKELIGIVPINNIGSRGLVRSIRAIKTGKVFPKSVPSPDGYVDGVEYKITKERFYGN